MESWRTVWREGYCPGLSTAALIALRKALVEDDLRLSQGSTTTPPPLLCVESWPVEAADAIGFCGWIGEGLATVGEVEEYFARQSYDCDKRLGEQAACRFWLNHWDEGSRAVVFAGLLEEVNLALAGRGEAAAVAGKDNDVE